MSISVVCAGGLLCWEGARLTPISSWWPFELLDIFAPWIYLATLALLVLGLPFSPWRARVFVLVPLALIGWEYGGLFLPQSPPVVGTPLRVMTANLLISNRDRSGVTATIAAQRPDVLVVQELRPAMASHLADALAGPYPYQILEPNDSPFGGLGILSRYPMAPVLLSAAVSERCFCQRVSIDLGGRAVILVHVHPPKPDITVIPWGPVLLPTGFDVDVTRRALQEALQGLDTSRHPVLVAGDFNVSDRQPFYRELRRHYADAYREASWGFGFTFPNAPFRGVPPMPLVRLDYILHDDDWGAAAAQTGTMPGSDHRFLIADLALR